MNSLNDLWAKRFAHYMSEVQKYMRFVFTGHIAIVLVFLVGAGGYYYSEWLKTVDTSFPSEILVAVLVGALLMMSKPVTLLREPDQVYLLPLESHMPQFFKSALRYTFFSKLFVSIVPYIVTIPMLKATTTLSTKAIWVIVAVIIVLKWCNVQGEFVYRYANRGANVWLDYIVRFVVSALAVYHFLLEDYVFGILFMAVAFVYVTSLAGKVKGKPVPYEHFVKVEQNRMMSFYRFANYFTDVPHLRGSVRRRAYLNFMYSLAPFKQSNTHLFLVLRTFIRTDDHFYLWLRLTAISALAAAFVDLWWAAAIIAGVLSFATAYQMKIALLTSHSFTMDQLFPVPASMREQAVRTVMYVFMAIQAVVVLLCAIFVNPYFYLLGVIVFVVAFITERMTKTPEQM